MRMFRLEIKRVLKSRRTVILLGAAMLLSAVMAYLPVCFESINHLDENKNKVSLSGLDAISYKKDKRSVSDGEISPAKLKEALATYQEVVKQYGSPDSEEFPLEVYSEKILPISTLIRKLPEAFADPQTGQGADLTTLSADDLDNFYEQVSRHLTEVMKLERQDPAAQAHAEQTYARVSRPFQLYGGYSRDAFDYIELYIFVLILLCIAIAAPVFSGEYQSQADVVLRCTKYGRTRLAITKIAALTTIFTSVFTLCISLHLLISDTAFGFDSLKTSFQALFSIVSLPNLNLGQTQIVLAVCGLLTLLAMMSCTIYLSARCRDSVTVLLLSFLICLLPVITYSALGSNWLACLLPSGGVGMQNSIMYQLMGFNYLKLGSLSIWTPYAVIAAAVIEIPLFLFLAVRAYNRHQTI